MAIIRKPVIFLFLKLWLIPLIHSKKSNVWNNVTNYGVDIEMLPLLHRLDLIVFNADATFWPFSAERVKYPISVKDGNITDKAGHKLKIYPNITTVLTNLYRKNIRTGAYCNVMKRLGCNAVMKNFGLKKLVTYWHSYPSTTHSHLEQFRAKTDLPYRNMMYLDSFEPRVELATSLGMFGVLLLEPPNPIIMRESFHKFYENVRIQRIIENNASKIRQLELEKAAKEAAKNVSTTPMKNLTLTRWGESLELISERQLKMYGLRAYNITTKPPLEVNLEKIGLKEEMPEVKQEPVKKGRVNKKIGQRLGYKKKKA